MRRWAKSIIPGQSSISWTHAKPANDVNRLASWPCLTKNEQGQNSERKSFYLYQVSIYFESKLSMNILFTNRNVFEREPWSTVSTAALGTRSPTIRLLSTVVSMRTTRSLLWLRRACTYLICSLVFFQRGIFK